MDNARGIHRHVYLKALNLLGGGNTLMLSILYISLSLSLFSVPSIKKASYKYAQLKKNKTKLTLDF